MKKLFLLLAATLIMLTSCDLIFGEPEFVGTWGLEISEGFEMVMELTVDSFEMSMVAGEESAVFAKGSLEYTDTTITLTASHLTDEDTGELVAVSGADAEMGTMDWAVDGDTLTVSDDTETMIFTRK